jgi:hypothetical protein
MRGILPRRRALLLRVSCVAAEVAYASAVEPPEVTARGGPVARRG